MNRFKRPAAWLALVVVLMLSAISRLPEDHQTSVLARVLGQDTSAGSGDRDAPAAVNGQGAKRDGDTTGGQPGGDGPSDSPAKIFREQQRSGVGRGTAKGSSGMSGMPGMGKNEGGAFLPNAGLSPKNYIQSPNVGLLMNEAGDKLWGYSVPLGKWTGLTIPKTDKRPVPTVSSEVGLFTADDCIYAFSSKTGRWDTLKTNRRMVVNVYPQQALFEDQGTIHIFSNVTGRWSSSDDPADEGNRGRPGGDEVADAASHLLVDDRGRRIVLGTIDRDGDLEIVVSETSERLSAAELLESLKARMAEADRDVAQRVTEFRAGAPDQENLSRLKSRLEQSVKEAFERRQQAQRLEAEILRVKLQRVDARLLEREQAKSGIISRRVRELLESPAAVTPGAIESNEKPAQSGGPARISNRRGRGATPQYPAYVPRGTGTRTAGVVSEVDSEGRIVLSPSELSGIHMGDELVVSRPDFVHEDGTQQFYNFARLFVVQANSDSAVARIIEIARNLRDNEYVNEVIEAGQIVGTSIEKPETRPEVKHPELAPLQGRWRLDRWVDDGRVLPPGDLKRSRHLLFVNGDWFTLIDPQAGQILKRFRYQIRQSPVNAKPIVFSTGHNNTNGPPGVFEIDGATLRISLHNGPNWKAELEPGADRTFWEFAREDARSGEPGE